MQTATNLLRILTAASAIALLAPILGAHQPADHVTLAATVVDSAGNHVSTLGSGDFTVVEEGVAQTVTSVERVGDVPLALALLLDASNSMKGEFAKAQQMAVDCARQLRPGDAAALIGLDGPTETLQEFTQDRQQIERAIVKVKQRGSTSLHAAVFKMLKRFQSLAAREGDKLRRVIVVLSDGDDTSSLVTRGEVLDLARRGDTMVYALASNNGPLTRDGAELRQLAEDTGGRRFEPGRSLPITDICGQMFKDLSNQYRVRYVSSSPLRDGKWRRVDVRVNVPGARVWTRAGYVPPKSNPK